MGMPRMHRSTNLNGAMSGRPRGPYTVKNRSPVTCPWCPAVAIAAGPPPPVTSKPAPPEEEEKIASEERGGRPEAPRHLNRR